jgi:hypothetical protein
MALGSTQPLKEMSSRDLPEGKGAAGAWGWQPHCHLWADCLRNVGASTSHNTMDLHGLLQRYRYVFTSSFTCRMKPINQILPCEGHSFNKRHQNLFQRLSDRTGSCSGKALHWCSEGAWFEPQSRDWLAWGFTWFCSVGLRNILNNTAFHFIHHATIRRCWQRR